MSNITYRLRHEDRSELANEAADEIERLREALKVARDFIESLPYEPSIAPSTKTQDAIVDALAPSEDRT